MFNMKMENTELQKAAGVKSTLEAHGLSIDDVNLSSPSNGQVLQYDNASSKWVNATPSSGSGHNYSTTEQVIGTWIDGKPLYEKTFETTSPSNSNSDISVADITNLNIDSVISTNGYCLLTSDYFIPLGFYGSSSSHAVAYSTKTAIVCNVGSSYTSKPIKVTIQYTKTTD